MELLFKVIYSTLTTGTYNPLINLKNRALLKDILVVLNQQPSAHQFSGLAHYESSGAYGEQTHKCLEYKQQQLVRLSRMHFPALASRLCGSKSRHHEFPHPLLNDIPVE